MISEYDNVRTPRCVLENLKFSKDVSALFMTNQCLCPCINFKRYSLSMFIFKQCVKCFKHTFILIITGWGRW